MEEQQIREIFRRVLHGGLKEFKVRNSKVKALEPVPTHKKGAIAGFFSKASMAQDRGVVFTSLEGLEEKAARLSHWTPNVYNYLTYVEPQKKHLKGHQENNLSQLNTFVVDLDFKDAETAKKMQEKVFQVLTIADIFLPTLVLATDKGYHVYYVLDEPVYLKRHANQQLPALNAAKKIANNIKQYLQQKLFAVDVGCNNFGIFRIPHKDNVIFYEPWFTVNFAEIMTWSKEFTQREQKKTKTRIILRSNRVKGYLKQIKQPWFKSLLQVTDIRPGEGLGRHNTIFTLALACYSSEMAEQRCFDLLDEFNSRLKQPIENKDVVKSVHDAFSGRYSGASRAYIRELTSHWLSEDPKNKISPQNWYKHKKKRKDRIYSHQHEWEEDLLGLLNNQITADGFVCLSMRKIKEKMGISLASLDRVLKSLRENKKIFYRPGQGRKAAQIATVTTILKYLQKQKTMMTTQYHAYLKKWLDLIPKYKKDNLVHHSSVSLIDDTS
ncbi:MAG TPA: primase C-terminal domain-containing protein [Enterococcus faecalis]|nr:primase C-terminal domain-containing protein [Enterococcus faecalis]